MFYSQFILAKKGPLGTIWIAAHLERKLRKNQVADTDIGVSVDSIMFPDVPIALRLSSHLLLGVVRIYSRKVGYLFDDCSEALLKVKQAFRSTAVDLPPEESTAPYHSITLPETFDLDDFELPDNDIYQGNYVDHHISSREQITLQDTMEGVVYTSSQFGLDERFGDGETSGLDLDEELFLDKDAAAHASILSSSDADPQTSAQPTACLKLDENDEGIILNQIEGVDEDTDFTEDAHAPCTPGLVEELNLSNIQETSACEDNLESEEHNLTEVAARENLENASSELEHHQNKDLLDSSFPSDTHPDGVLCMEVEENDAGNQDIKLPREKPCIPVDDVGAVSFVSELSRIVASSEDRGRENDIRNGVESEEHAVHSNDGACVELQEPRLETNSTTTYQLVSGGISEHDQASRDLETSCTFSDMLVSNCQLHDITEFENPQLQAQEPKNSDNIDPSVIEGMPSTETPILHRCCTPLREHSGADYSVQPELPSKIDALGSPERSQKNEALHTSGVDAATGGSQVLEEHCITEPALLEDLQAVCRKSNDCVEYVAGDNQLEHLKGSADSDLPAPEKLLSVPEGIADLPSAFLVESTPDHGLPLEGDGGEDGSKNISGKKRSFTESRLTMQSLESVESLGVVLSKRTAESVPDDDDLLSSILAGRRSSVLKVKPTPLLEIRPMKRPRSAPWSNASKRKVLMDETMVLHGDTIRQQLTNSEDIRRVRKKAPCTLPEMSMIQKQFLEDQIFNQSIFTGLSMELVSLHNQTYDLREIRVLQHDANSTSSEAAQDVKTLLDDENTAYMEGAYGKDLSARSNDTMGTTGELQRSEALAITENDEVQPLGTPLPNRNQHEGHVQSLETCTETQVKPTSDEVPVMTSSHELLGEIGGIEISGRYEASADVVNASVESLNPTAELLYDANDLSTRVVHLASLDIAGVADASLQMDAPVASPSQKLDSLPSETDCPLLDTNIEKVFANDIANKKDDDDITAVETDFKMRDGILLEENFAATSYYISKDTEIESSLHKSSSPSLTFFPEIGDCSTQVKNTNQAMEGIRDHNQEISNYDEVLAGEVECNSKNSIANGLYGLETSHPFNVNGDGSSILLNNVENHGWQEACALGVTYSEFSSVDRVDPDDFDYSSFGHDTEFLNVDDDDVAEADDSCVPNSEETIFLDNSGWSSRTRAVAKYLQTLFDKEAERGRNVFPMDNLLVGKTRKEASRMFFEALVLKTRDYIHVEQEKPFGNINMKPRGKLLKSDY